MANINPPSPTGGVKPMSITGRMVRERERLIGMSDAERAWRAQWLKDQVLAHDEPCVPENWYRERYNVIRRFYRAPLDRLENALRKPMGEIGSGMVRHIIGKTSLAICGVWLYWYHIKYNRGDWTKKSSAKITTSRRAVYPGDPGFPKYETRKDDDFASFGFKNSPI